MFQSTVQFLAPECSIEKTNVPGNEIGKQKFGFYLAVNCHCEAKLPTT